MTDDSNPEPNGDQPLTQTPASPGRPQGAPSNGSGGQGSGGSGQVRSGLANRRNPALATLGEVGQGVRQLVFRDKLTTFLALASIVIAVAFALLLGSIGPSSSGTPDSDQHRRKAGEGKEHHERDPARPRQPCGAPHKALATAAAAGRLT